MSDLTPDFNNVWSALINLSQGNGATIMFIGARSQIGTSFCASNFANIAVKRATKGIWLLDLDFFSNAQFENYRAKNNNFSGPFDMCFGARPFWRLVPSNLEIDLRTIIVGMRVNNSKLFISRFRHEKLGKGQNIQIGPSPKFWETLKKNIEITIIDAPSTDTSRAGLAIAQDMDAIVLVVNSNSNVEETEVLRDEIYARGGNIIGIIMVEDNAIKQNEMS